MTHEIDDFITRDEAATLAGCSADTIKRDIQQNGLPTRVGLGGKVMVRVGDLIDCGRISRDVLDHGMTASDSVALKSARAELERVSVRCAKLEGQLEESKASVSDLRGQLKAKDNQIAELLSNLTRLIAANHWNAA